MKYILKPLICDIYRKGKHVGKFRKIGGIWLFVGSQTKYPLNSTELIELARDLHTLNSIGEI